METIRGFGTLYQQPGSKNWWMKFYHRGKAVRRTTSTPILKKARDILIDEVTKARGAGAAYSVEQEHLSFNDLVDAVRDDYRIKGKRSEAAIQVRMKHLGPVFGETPALKITTPMMVRYQRERLAEGAARATVNREMALFKRAFNLAAKNGTISKANLPGFPENLKEDNVRQGFVDRAGMEAVRDAMPEELRDPLAFAYRSGWRIGAVMALQWHSVDLANRIVSLERRSSKNERPWLLPLEDPELFAIIERAHQRRRPDCPYVFHYREGQRLLHSTFRKQWLKATAKAGVAGLLIHDFRRSAVRNLTRSGAPDLVAMRITGHRTRSVFDRYNITAEDDLRAAMRGLGQYLGEQPNSPKVSHIAHGASARQRRGR